MRWLGETVPDETDMQADHRHLASEENDKIAIGVQLRANYGDEDSVHIDEHMHYTTTAEYRRARQANPNVEIIMRLHIRDHLYNKADKEFRPVALAKRVQADLINEYQLMPPGGPAGAKPAGAPGQGSPPGEAPRQPALPGMAGGGPPPGAAGLPASGAATARPVPAAGGTL
jgi:hypothetical protein